MCACVTYMIISRVISLTYLWGICNFDELEKVRDNKEKEMEKNNYDKEENVIKKLKKGRRN